MPNYCIVVTNVSNHASRQPRVGGQQVEYCTAPDPETVNEMVKKNISRTDNPADYTWTITEQP
jgi:hypothetical protein